MDKRYNFVIEATEKKINRKKSAQMQVGFPVVEVPIDHLEYLVNKAKEVNGLENEVARLKNVVDMYCDL